MLLPKAILGLDKFTNRFSAHVEYNSSGQANSCECIYRSKRFLSSPVYPLLCLGKAWLDLGLEGKSQKIAYGKALLSRSSSG